MVKHGHFSLNSSKKRGPYKKVGQLALQLLL